MFTTEGSGVFITFEGIDGSGKTTQMRILAERLRRDGYEVLQTVEPGGTEIGTQIRRILLDSANQELSPSAELLLYFAARAQNVDQWIRPALQKGSIVLSDRFTDSTLAYQGAARGLGEDVVRSLDAIACRGLQPDLTVFVDVELATGLERTKGDRMDAQSAEFHRKVREAYESLLAREPRRFRRVDGSGDVATVAAAVWQAVEPVLRRKAHV